MTDITTRLRKLYVDTGSNYVQEAADLIEALRQRVKDANQGAERNAIINRELAQELAALKQQGEAAERWKEAVLDQCMIAHSAFHDGDPRRTLDVLIDWHVKVALDPQVSAEAQALVNSNKHIAK